MNSNSANPALLSGFNPNKGKHQLRLVLLFLCVLVSGCSEPKEYQFKGATMGTFYSVKLITDARLDRSAMAESLHQQAEIVNQLMSNWVKDSDVSRFNYGPGPVTLSQHTATVVTSALATADLTQGAYDPSIGPLVELWGFGAKNREQFPPQIEIDSARQQVGYQKLVLDGLELSKNQPDIQINLSANAKGYAIDLMAAYLKSKGFSNFMVEVGGDVRVAGHNLSGDKWRMAIEDPGAQPWQSIYRIANLTDAALATSGDYRNYFEHQGIRYSHIIDPRSGLPVPAVIASVSVVAPDCMTADALATALMVMPPEEGKALIEAQSGVECLIILRDEQDGLKSIQTSGMDNLLTLPAQVEPKQAP